jgi:hypothetical protein
MRRMLLSTAALLGLAACDGDSGGTTGPLVPNITGTFIAGAQTWTQLAPTGGRPQS